MAPLASDFGVKPSQITAWKKPWLTHASESELYEQIGRLKMKVEWLKKRPRVWIEA